MHSSTSHSEFKRPIPDLPWRGLLLAVGLLVTAAVAAWEIHARRSGYVPTLNDTADLWAEARTTVEPDSVVLIGTSRMLFDIDLDVLERDLGQRPVQLAIVGSSPFPILADLAAEKSFRGTVVLDVVPAMYFAPGGPPVEASERALKRYRNWNYAQRWSHQLAMKLEERLAFLQQEDLTLGKLLERLPIPNRPQALVGPKMPPYFYTLDRDRRARMAPEAATVGSPLQQQVVNTWLPLFTPPPPPSFVPAEQFQQMMAEAVESRFRERRNTCPHPGARRQGPASPVAGHGTAPRARGDADAARRHVGPPAARDRCARIDFQEHPELSAFDCPE